MNLLSFLEEDVNVDRRNFLKIFGIFLGLKGLEACVRKINLPELRMQEQVIENRIVNSIQDTWRITKGMDEMVIKAIIHLHKTSPTKAVFRDPLLGEKRYGLMRIPGSAVILLEKKYPLLPRVTEDSRRLQQNRLLTLPVNMAYGMSRLEELMSFYDGNLRLAIADFDAGSGASDRANVQLILNKLIGMDLRLDGINGKKTREAVRKFQEEWNENIRRLEKSYKKIVVDGVVGKETKRALAVAWVDSSLGLIPEGVIPDNGRTRDYVRNYLEVLVFTNLKSSYNDLMSEVKKLPGIKTNKN